MEALDLTQYMKVKRKGIFRIKLFDEASFRAKAEVPNEETQIILDTVHELKDTIDISIEDLKVLLFESLDQDFAMKSKGDDDSTLLENLKAKIMREWHYLKTKYENCQKKIKETVKPSA